MVVVGFVGTGRGMAVKQYAMVAMLIRQLHGQGAFHLHHGQKVGACQEVHDLAIKWDYTVYLHPPDTARGVAACAQGIKLPPAPPGTRNRNIVDVCDVLLVAPGERLENMANGTWQAVRYAREIERSTIIIYPNGNVSVEGPNARIVEAGEND